MWCSQPPTASRILLTLRYGRSRAAAGGGLTTDVMQETKMNKDYQTIGAYAVHEAKKLLAAFEQAGLRFKVRVDESHFKNMPDVKGITGGRFGLSKTVVIDVHADDFQTVQTMIPKVLKYEV